MVCLFFTAVVQTAENNSDVIVEDRVFELE